MIKAKIKLKIRRMQPDNDLGAQGLPEIANLFYLLIIGTLKVRVARINLKLNISPNFL